MALMKSKHVPEDAVVLDETAATTYVWDIITNWDSPSDTWALRYTPMVLGGLNALTGIIINNHYRKKLKLGNFGYFSSVIPISVMPGLLTALFHRHLISTEMLLMKKEACPVCYEVRSAALQLTVGVAYPMLLGPTTALMLASRYGTYRVPDLIEGPRVMWQFLRKITRPFNGTLTTLVTIQCIASSVLTYFEMRNNYTVREKLAAIENKLSNDQSINRE